MALDKDFYFDILTNVRKYNGSLTFYKNTQLICALPPDELREIILSWLELMEKTGPVDFEMVRQATWVCPPLNRLDEDVMEWINSNPIEIRREIGFSFISGYWAVGRQPSEKCLAFLTEEIDGKLPKQSVSYAFALTALYVVADPVDNMEIGEQARRELSKILLGHLQYLEEKNIHPIVAESLRKLKDFEKRKFYAIFETAKDPSTSELNGKKLSDVINALVNWLEIRSKPEWFDQECIFSAGQYLGYTGRPEFEQAVCEWVSKEPTQEHFAVAGTFLRGHWQMTDIKPTCNEFLQQAKARFMNGTDAYEAITLALAVAAEKKQALSEKLS